MKTTTNSAGSLAGIVSATVAVVGLTFGITWWAFNLTSRVDGVETKVDGVEVKVDGVEVKVDGVEAKVDGVETNVKVLGQLITVLGRQINEVPEDSKSVVKHVGLQKIIANRLQDTEIKLVDASESATDWFGSPLTFGGLSDAEQVLVNDVATKSPEDVRKLLNVVNLDLRRQQWELVANAMAEG